MNDDYILPSNILTVIIRNDAPVVHLGDCSTYRSIQIGLTKEQLNKLKLNMTGQSGDKKEYESISKCFIE